MSGSGPVVLAAGDGFVRPELLVRELRATLGDPAGGRGPELRELALPWPDRPFGPVAEVEEASGDEDTLVAALDGVEVAVTQLAPFTAAVFRACPRLRLVAVCRGGPVNVNLAAATAAGVPVCYAPGRNARAAAEFAVGLMIAACRNVVAGHVELAGGSWGGHYYRYDAAGFELGDSTVGLVGYGAVGSRVARLLAGFGARVLVYDPYAGPVEPAVTRVDELADLLGRSRVVSLHQRLTPETRGMIGAAEIASMPAGSVLVNTGRGGVLDADAACDALESGHLAGLALDVFPTESLPAGSRLLRTPGVVLTPHIAGCSRQVAERAARICAGEVARYLRGEPPEHCANPDVLGAGPDGLGPR